MKKRILIIVVLATLLVSGWTWTATSQKHQGYVFVRGAVQAVDSNATLIDLTTEGDYTQIPAGAFEFSRDKDAAMSDSRMVRFVSCITDDSGTDASYTVQYIGWRADNGAAEVLFSVVYTAGTQQVVKYPESRTTACGVTTAYWAATAVKTERSIACDVFNSGNNNIAVIECDMRGFVYVYPQVTAISDAATLAGIKFYKSDF
ncbi:MAG: hypothetical protein Q7T18_03250 [Sedimentisphaerales bacterium]|nr:hypothetical protein [Sedimentisphaerales bacterium]